MDPQPPRLAILLTRLRCRDPRGAEVEADLQELFDARLAAHGPRYARRAYWCDALSVWIHGLPSWQATAAPPAERRPTTAQTRQPADAPPSSPRLEPIMSKASLPHAIAQDTTYAIRLFARHGGGLAVTVAGVVLALGLSTALVAALNAVLFPRVGVPDPESLFWVRLAGDVEPGPAGSGVAFRQGWTHRDFETMRDGVTSTAFASFVLATRSIRTGDGESRDDVRMAFVSGEFFEVTGVGAALGRLIDRRDERSGERVAVVSHDLWSRLYARSRDVVGSMLYVNDEPFVVVGVAQAGFLGPSNVGRHSVWLPATAVPPDRDAHLNAGTSVLARLPDGTARARFRAQAVAAVEQATGRRVEVALERAVEPLRFHPGEGAAILSAVLVLVASVVFVAIVNLAGFLLTLATMRQREIGVRLAMGATRGRLVRQFLTESLLIGGLVAALSVPALHGCVALLMRVLDLPLGTAIEVDGRAYAFLIATTMAAAIAAGLTPLRYAARLHVAADLSGDASRLRILGRPERLRSGLVAAQVAVAVVLIVTSALLTRAAATARTAAGVAGPLRRAVRMAPSDLLRE